MFVVMNTKTRQNPSKPIVNEYAADSYYDGMIICRWIGGTEALFAVPTRTPVSASEQIGYRTYDAAIDTGMGNRRVPGVKVVGFVAKDGITDGEVPTKSVPVYVFK